VSYDLTSGVITDASVEVKQKHTTFQESRRFKYQKSTILKFLLLILVRISQQVFNFHQLILLLSFIGPNVT